METEVVKNFQVGVEQGRESSMDRPTDTKGELRRLNEERQN